MPPAVLLNPYRSPGRTRPGETLAEKDDTSGALEAFGKALARALRLRPDHAGTHLSLAEVLLTAGRTGDARTQAEAAARLGADASPLLQAISSAGTVPQQ